MSDAKNKLPGIPKPATAPKSKPPVIRGGTEPVREVKIVSPDQVKTRRPAKAAGQNPAGC